MSDSIIIFMHSSSAHDFLLHLVCIDGQWPLRPLEKQSSLHNHITQQQGQCRSLVKIFVCVNIDVESAGHDETFHLTL